MDTKLILWENVKSQMIKKYGKENLYKTHIDSLESGKNKQISLSSLQRIKSKETAVGLDVLDKLAYFFELEPWQLLVPKK